MNAKIHPIQIFIAYSCKDLTHKEEIRKRLRPLQRAGKVDIWDNYDIEAGKDWDTDIREKLDNSDLILLLLSPDALDSDYFYEVEAPIALQRHEAGEAIAVGILLRPCVDMLKHTPLGDFTKYEMLPKKGYPVVDSHWHNADEAYLTIFQEVDVLVGRIEMRQALENSKNDEEHLSPIDENIYEKCGFCRGSGSATRVQATLLGRFKQGEIICPICGGIGRVIKKSAY